ncbi:gamma-aminobutyric acid receptor alpha-like isoform X2 [Tachypleus tridentatus]|uniref:gamma-aminobutyric acid receptor alpha-like isoform X2 n=1 Tax=Tachypleus tridentatus TaxID=6853 RepID=UPI003FD12EE9
MKFREVSNELLWKTSLDPSAIRNNFQMGEENLRLYQISSAWLLRPLAFSIACHLMCIYSITTSAEDGLHSFNDTDNSNISKLLDGLLEGYDNRLRPDFGGSPTLVYIDIEVRSMGPISEVEMSYSMDCYFRQSWIDRRLAFTGSMATLALSISMLERIWRPDTYFYNGEYSYLHTITSPNKFMRLHQNGKVLYSSRLTIKADCPMNLENFPMDMQRCPLRIGSFAYSTTNVMYQWNPVRKVVIHPDMKMSQFDLIHTPSGNTTDRLRHVGVFSVLVASFHLQRHMGYFLIEVYAPCTMLVVLSWVSFWINREATADRVALGVTTVLTMTFLGLESRNDLPRVSYCTALDYYVAISFFFVFATITEFAVVHYYTKVGSGEYITKVKSEDDESFSDEWKPEEEPTNDSPERFSSLKTFQMDSSYAQHTVRRSLGRNNSQNGRIIRSVSLRKRFTVQQRVSTHLNSVSKLDKISRWVFPLSFLIINLIYWYTYLGPDGSS